MGRGRLASTLSDAIMEANDLRVQLKEAMQKVGERDKQLALASEQLRVAADELHHLRDLVAEPDNLLADREPDELSVTAKIARALGCCDENDSSVVALLELLTPEETERVNRAAEASVFCSVIDAALARGDAGEVD